MERGILVTGATGFVGSALVEHLLQQGFPVVAVTRSPGSITPAPGLRFLVKTLTSTTDWSADLADIDTVIHLAARVHQLGEVGADELEHLYDETNRAATIKLAQDCAAQGVRRFIFVSSIKVNGDWTAPGSVFRADDEPAPADAYARSKAAAERALLALMATTGLEVVIVRPTLVYGPGAKANVARLLQLLERGLPLPLGSVRHNRRSLLALENLVDLLTLCIEAPRAAGAVLLASDGEDVSTTELLELLGKGMQRSVRLLPVPGSWLTFLARMVGRGDIAQRLCGSLQVDSAPTRKLLGWQPRLDSRSALMALGAAHRQRSSS